MKQGGTTKRYAVVLDVRSAVKDVFLPPPSPRPRRAADPGPRHSSLRAPTRIAGLHLRPHRHKQAAVPHQRGRLRRRITAEARLAEAHAREAGSRAEPWTFLPPFLREEMGRPPRRRAPR